MINADLDDDKGKWSQMTPLSFCYRLYVNFGSLDREIPYIDYLIFPQYNRQKLYRLCKH